MPKKKDHKSYTLYVYHIPVLILAGLFIFGATYFVENYQEKTDQVGAVLGKGNTKNNSNGKTDNPGKGNENKPDKAKKNNKGNLEGGSLGSTGNGSPNAFLHRQNVAKVVGNLKKTAEEQLPVDEELSEELEEVADEVEEDATEVTEAIKTIETRPKWKTVLLGADYKNLGQLRSHLAHNTNTIRKLVKTQAKVQNQGTEQAVQEQLGTLMEERERITGIIAEHEDDFGILGWASRLLSGYLGGGLQDTDLSDYVDVPESTESTQSMPGDSEPSTEDPASAQ
jgi:hypothetical protein